MPQRALLRAGFARCGGGKRAPGGGRLLPGCGASGVGRSPTSDHSSFRACGWGPIPTGCRCGGCGHGDPSPTPQRALLRAGFARCGGGTRAPGGGASCLGVGRPGTGALLPLTSRPFGRAAGAHYALALGAGDAGVGARHQPQSAHSCVLWGQHEDARGRRLLSGCGASGVGRSPTPDHSSFRACGRGPLPTGCGCGGCGRGDPSPTQQHALLRAGFARCGGATRVPRGAPLAWAWGVRGQALSHPRPAVLSGVRLGPASHLPWVRCAGVGARLSLAPCPVPRFIVCCARCPGSRHPVAAVAWHLSSCRGCGRRRACLACLVARVGAPVGFPVAVVPSPYPGSVAPGFTGWLRGAPRPPPQHPREARRL